MLAVNFISNVSFLIFHVQKKTWFPLHRYAKLKWIPRITFGLVAWPIDNRIDSGIFSTLKKCRNKFDCPIHEMLIILGISSQLWTCKLTQSARNYSSEITDQSHANVYCTSCTNLYPHREKTVIFTMRMMLATSKRRTTIVLLFLLTMIIIEVFQQTAIFFFN